MNAKPQAILYTAVGVVLGSAFFLLAGCSDSIWIWLSHLVPQALRTDFLKIHWVLPLISCLVPLPLLFAFPYRYESGKRAFLAFTLSLCALAGACLLYFGKTMVLQKMNAPDEWDFLAFWTFAQVGNSGSDFYKPEFFQLLKLPWTPSTGFVNETLKVGFLYPPITMFLFLPLAWLGVTQGFLLWYAAIFAAMAASIYLLWSYFLREEGFSGLLFSAALVLFFPSTKDIMYYGQTLFFALCALLGFWRSRNAFKSGMALAFGLAIKPLFMILVLVPVLKKSWRTLSGFAATSFALGILAMAYFGLGTVLSYFTEKPASKLPLSVYVESVNQSLSSFFLKLGFGPLGHSPAITLPFVLVALILVGITAWAVHRCPAEEYRWGLSLTIMLALLIYPGSQTHYGVLGLPALFMIWKYREKLPGGTGRIPFAIVSIYIADAFGFVLMGNLVLWSLVLAMSPGLPWSGQGEGPAPHRPDLAAVAGAGSMDSMNLRRAGASKGSSRST